MSTWLSSFSLPNPFNSDSDDGEDHDNVNFDEPLTDHQPRPPYSPNSASSPTAGVRQDLSALSQSFSQHLRGVAAFLAPPPSSSPPHPSSTSDSYLADEDASTASTNVRRTASPPAANETITGIKKDLVEIGGSFKALFSSSSSGISKFASNLLQFQGDDAVHDDDGDDQEEEESQEEIPGFNEEVVDFVRKVSSRPELWTDFPLSLPHDFDMSDVQKEHAAAIEELVPSVMTLKQSCSDMSDGQFWMIYFILLLPRLNEVDLELLSTSQIVELRETLLKKLQNKKEAQVESSGISETGNASAANQEINAAQGNDSLSVSVDVSPEKASSTGDREVEIPKVEEPLKHGEGGQNRPLNDLKYSEDVDDVSFSDLEDEDNDLSDRVSGVRPTQSGRASSASESNEWVRLNENYPGAQGSQNKSGLTTRPRGKDSEGEESSDWLTVDDSDTDTLAGAV